MMTAAQELSRKVGVRAACEALEVSPATFYRRRQSSSASKPSSGRASSPRALAPKERQTVHDTLNSERFVDQAPTEVYATLLDAGKYLCSVRTMYRILEEHAELVLFFTLNREDFSFVIHLDRQPRTSRRWEAQTGSRARSGSRSERTLDAVEHSRTLMEWWPFLIFHRGGLRIKVINNTQGKHRPATGCYAPWAKTWIQVLGKDGH